jgi:CRP-like cAMP-binding protein
MGFMAALSSAHCHALASMMTLRRYRAGELVIRRGEPGDELFLVCAGCFTIAIDHRGMDGLGDTTRLATFGPGMCFGEISFITGSLRSADVIAVESGSCWVLERPQFEELRQRDPDVIIELLQALTVDLGRKLAQTSLQLTLMEHH